LTVARPKFLYDNRFADATPVASSTAAGDYNVLNLRDWRPYTWWKPSAMPATVTVDAGSAKAADYALIYGHDLFTQGATVEVRSSTDNFSASDVLQASSTPASNDPVLLTFNSASFRYWRLRFTGATAPSIAIGVIGAALESTEYFDGEFDPVRRRVHATTNRNENGHPLGRAVLFESWEHQLKLPNVAWSWARDTFIPAWKSHLRGSPFGFVWESALYPGDVHLVQAGDDLRVPHRAGSLCDVIIDVDGVAP
jgi:hypothetical protein